jgi:amino acid permease
MKISESLKAYFIIISTIIGLGIFVLPYTFWKSGYYFIFWILFLTILFFLLHLIFGEILLQTKEKHNLPGLAGVYLHPLAKHIVWLFDFLGMLGVFWVYFIALAKFWSLILPINPLFIKIAFALFNLFFILKDIRLFAQIETFLSLGIFVVFFSIVLMIIPQFNFENLKLAFKNNFEPLLPYGIIIFALSGTSAVPFVIDLVGKNKKSFLKINLFALITIVLLYLMYAFVVIGFLGNNVSEESLQSLSNYLHKFFLFLAVIFVTLNITFIDMAFYLKRGLNYDYKLNPKIINLIMIFSILPLAFFEPLSLISLMSLISEIFLGFNLLILCLIYLKLPKKEYFRLPNLLVIFMALIFVLGIIYGILPK